MTSSLRSAAVAVPLDPYRYLEQLPEPDGSEVEEWADSVDGLLAAGGARRARRVLLHVLGRARARGPSPSAASRR